MQVVERYKRNGFELVLTTDKTLVRTPLQVFLLTAQQYSHGTYIDTIRMSAEKGEIKDMNELCGMFYKIGTNERVINMIPVRECWYV
jgi:hypothetical protein